MLRITARNPIEKYKGIIINFLLRRYQMAKNKDIWELKLHETITLNDFSVTRVPGGWIYRFTTQNDVNFSYQNAVQSESAVFVPFITAEKSFYPS